MNKAAGVAALALMAGANGVAAQETLPPSVVPPQIRAVPAPPPSPEALRTEEDFERDMAETVRREGMFGVVVKGMSRDEQLVMCGMVAEHYAATAAEATDPAIRFARLGDVWRLQQRLATPLEEAKARLGESGTSSAKRQAGQALSLMSMAPDPSLEAEIRAGEDLMYVFVRSIAERCDTALDALGIARVTGDPPPDFVGKNTRFKYRGDDYEVIFAGTGLAPFAAQMCRGEAAPDLDGAPLDQRGKHGMSLLDWAMECEDRAAFDALIAAGMDLEAVGLWEDPPMVHAATEKRMWYLTRLLDSGASPDAMGRTNTALREATSDLDAINFGGDTRAAFNLLRARGASLNFPDFSRSIWFEWGLHETRWDLILAHWDEFDSDPVELASLLEGYLSGDWAWAKKEHEGAARKVKALLATQHGVCFPVGNTREMDQDERGYTIQPDCPAGG